MEISLDESSLWEQFVHSMSHDGRVLVALELLSETEEIGESILNELDASYRKNFHREAPLLCLETSRWAAKVLYSICSLVVQRQHDVNVLHDLLQQRPEVSSASQHYSADLWFHVFPELLKIIRLKSHDDPLIECIRGLCIQYPLSSLGSGFEDMEQADLKMILNNKSLLFFFVDRMLSHEEWKWLAVDCIRSRVRTIIGDQDQDFQLFNNALKDYDERTHSNDFTDTQKTSSGTP